MATSSRPMAHGGEPASTEVPRASLPATDLAAGSVDRPEGPGLYLHWDGRRSYRTRMPAPRVLEPVQRYSYGDDSSSRVIEGDNLQVMVSLRSQYRSRVDVAYLDPPYNTGRSDFRFSDRRFNDPNADSDDAVYVNSEDGGRHTKWLNYMGPRLYLVWELLADHGVCFVSISGIELFRLGMLMDEIFGERHRLGVLVWKGAIENNPTHIAEEHEYILCYAKREDQVPRVWEGSSAAKTWLQDKFFQLQQENPGSNVRDLERRFQRYIQAHERARKHAVAEKGTSDLVDLGRAARYKYVDERGVYATEDHTDKPFGGYHYDVIHPLTGRPCKRPASGYRFKEETMRRLLLDDRIVFRKDHTLQFQIKKYLSEVSEPLRSVIDIPAKLGTATLKRLLGSDHKFLHPKPVELIELLIQSMGYADPLVLDPFAGSATTGHAVLRMNARDGGKRRFIMIEEGSHDDRYCRTLTTARLRKAIDTENLGGGFSFETAGRRVDRDVILELERDAIANLIIQTDVTGVGRGITKLAGKYIIGANSRDEAITLCWNGRTRSRVDREVLRAMFGEVKELGLNKPMRVYGTTCTVGETDSFRFCQIPDEILAALQLAEEEAETEDEALTGSLEVLEAAVQDASLTKGSIR
jgi:adenine-specific DNA-methyltransferase